MIIVFYSPITKISGGIIVMKKYAEFLVDKGHQVYVIAGGKENKEFIESGVIYRYFNKKLNNYVGNFLFLLPYINEFYKNTPHCDVIIPIFFPLVIHALYTKKMKKCKKIISLFQDVKEMYWFGKYIYFLLGRKFIHNNIDDIIAISTPIAKEIEKYSSFKPIVIKNSIDKEYFYNRELEKENYILFVGSSSAIKGLHFFLETFYLLKKDFPYLKAKIVSNTNTTSYSTDEYVEYINIKNDKNELAKIYSKAIVFVSQSLADSFGLPPLEAMASGTAVVLTNTVGAKEYAKNGKNCFVVSIKDPVESAKKVKILLKNRTLRESIEKEGLKTVKKYDWNISCEKFRKLIEKDLWIH